MAALVRRRTGDNRTGRLPGGAAILATLIGVAAAIMSPPGGVVIPAGSSLARVDVSRSAEPAAASPASGTPLRIMLPAKSSWPKSGVLKLRDGVQYSVALSGKKVAVKLTCTDGPWDVNPAYLSVGGKRVFSGYCGEAWDEVDILRLSSSQALIYIQYCDNYCSDTGTVYRYAGTKLVKVKSLTSDEEVSLETVKPTSAGAGQFTIKYLIDAAFGGDEYWWTVTYRYASSKVSVAKVTTTNPSYETTTAATSAKYAKYCPGYIAGNTTDVSVTAIKHPTLGAVSFLACKTRVSQSTPYGDDFEDAGPGTVSLIDAKGKIRWTSGDDDWDFEFTWKLASPATDATGNVFVRYNPGRYDGYEIFRAEGTGMTKVGDFYYADLIGPGADGRYTIKQYNNDCEPDCASGTITSKTYAWNGSAYVEQ